MDKDNLKITLNTTYISLFTSAIMSFILGLLCFDFTLPKWLVVSCFVYYVACFFSSLWLQHVLTSPDKTE